MLLGLAPFLLTAQSRYKRGHVIGNHFGVTAEVGVTTFFGDISGEGSAPGGISNNLAYKFKGNWNLKEIVDISGRVSVGKISGEKISSGGSSGSHSYFITEFTEYTVDVGVNIFALLLKSHRDKFGLYVNAGLGLIDFKVKLFDGKNDSVLQTYGYEGQQSTTERVLPIGGRFIYHITPAHAVSIQTTLSQVDTDKLDGKTGNNNTDFYNYFSIGYTYKIHYGVTGKQRPGGGRSSGRLNNSRTRYRR